MLVQDDINLEFFLIFFSLYQSMNLIGIYEHCWYFRVICSMPLWLIFFPFPFPDFNFEYCINIQVDDMTADLIISQLLFLDAEDQKKDIKLFINSPGGSVTAGMFHCYLLGIKSDACRLVCLVGLVSLNI